MRVLMWVGDTYEGIPGGHRVQADKTAEALRGLGVQVEVGQRAALRNSDFDVLHVMDGSAYAVRIGRAARTPVVVSTIYWSKHYRVGPRPDASAFQRVAYAGRLGWSVWRRGAANTADAIAAGINEQRLAFESADLLLPNSEGEGRAVADELGVTTPFHVIPNAVDPALFPAVAAEANPRSGVLCVGRLEPHKNQLGLIRALGGTGLHLTLVGPIHPHHEAYHRLCKRVAGPDVTFAGRVTTAELVSRYSLSAVHALPSWFETTGLSSLEAAAAGAAVVTTARGFARDYFGDLAEYCEPKDGRTIRDAVLAALERGAPSSLREHVLSNYTWEHTGNATLAAYQKVL